MNRLEPRGRGPKRLSKGQPRLARLAFAGCLFAGLLAGCETTEKLKDLKIPGVYRLDVQQGNVLDAEKVKRLELGMDKRKVSFLVGTPSIRDVFHQDRWDYVYTFQPGGGEPEQRRLSLFFENERLARMTGNARDELANSAAPERPKARVVNVPPDSRKRSFISRINPWSDENQLYRRNEEEAATAPQGPDTTNATPDATSGEATTPAPETSAGTTVGPSDADNPTAGSSTAAPAPTSTSETTASDSEQEEQGSLFKRLSDQFSLPEAPPTNVLGDDR